MAQYGTMTTISTSDKLAATQSMGDWMSERRGLFPSIFTLAASAAFVPPVIVGMTIAMDPSVEYWVGMDAWFVLLVAPLLLLGHATHSVGKGANIAGVALSTILPAIVVTVIGFDVSSRIFRVNNRLKGGGFAFDQSERQPSDILNEAYTAAESLLEDCVTFVAHGQTLQSEAQLRDVLTLEDCPTYIAAIPSSDQKAALEHKFEVEQQKWFREWRYLSGLERQQECAGWANQGGKQMLWVASWPRIADPCLQPAVNALRNRFNLAVRLMVIGIGIALAGLATLTTVKTTMGDVVHSLRADAKGIPRDAF